MIINVEINDDGIRNLRIHGITDKNEIRCIMGKLKDTGYSAWVSKE